MLWPILDLLVVMFRPACFQDLTTVSGIISDIGEVTAGSLDQWSGFHYNLTATGLWLAVVWPI